ncbi:MAG: AMP-binding protein [Methanobacteriaceae archaeon]
MKGQILLTGANGFIGTQIALWLIENTKHHVIALVRADDEETAINRLKRSWWDWPELLKSLEDRVEVIPGDVTLENLGWDDNTFSRVAASATHIIHTVADLRLHAPREDLETTNLQGTINLLKLANRASVQGNFQRFSHISTAYVAGKQLGEIGEDELKRPLGFWSNYEESKYEAENAVRESGLPYSIFRPGMVVGNSETGEIKTFNTIYILLKLYLTGQLRFIPTSPSMKLNPIPVDYVAQAVGALTLNPETLNMTFHLTPPPSQMASIKEILEKTREWAREKLQLNLPHPIFIPISSLIQKLTPSSDKKRNPGLLNVLIILAPYLDEKRVFKTENSEKYLGPYELVWKQYLHHLLDYAVYRGFFHRSERTVHEQVLFRLKSRSFPVKFYDVIEGQIREKSASLMGQDILRASSALKKLGVEKNDRVALAGLNSTRYLALEVAIGLLGAVSVPLYYTIPPREIKNILKSCGAKILFIGTPHLMKRLGELSFEVPIISFCRESQKIPANILSWASFLEKGEDFKRRPTVVEFSDLATIRYTSGTTGNPKGVTFNHGNLRWMAESMASLPSWEERNREVRYLSFLPMNHVVEGILGSFAPYYAPAPLKLYFLENFYELPAALPLVKPTIFFSVPRFYEKIWSRLKNKAIGKYYLQSDEGIAKRILRPVIRRSILKQAGLNLCKQLIVGSATSSQRLLHDYQDLGVEIHNAYGLTEAPLVTLNRRGNNRIGTVGEPLPETVIKFGAEKEVMVKGPQVTPGYFEDELEPPLKDGWLCTGDLGYITSGGSLIITGRKKELIINSYGKSIDPLHIEALLRDLPQVAEVMLVGEGKPYLSALLWVDEDYSSEQIVQGISKINQDLSRPEQIKKWAIIANDLSIEGGDLTANMKLKREIISTRYQKVITALYQGTVEPCILDLGQWEADNES